LGPFGCAPGPRPSGACHRPDLRTALSRSARAQRHAPQGRTVAAPASPGLAGGLTEPTRRAGRGC
jgi:hypothetical protein